MDAKVRETFEEWRKNITDNDLIEEMDILALPESKDLRYDAFYRSLSFGTAGLTAEAPPRPPPPEPEPPRLPCEPLPPGTALEAPATTGFLFSSSTALVEYPFPSTWVAFPSS